AGLVLRMSGRGRILPKVGQIQAGRIQELAVPPVILDVLSAMSAHRYRQSHAIERLGSAFREVEQGVMCWIEFVAPGESAFHGDRNPMTEVHLLFFQITCELIRPPGKVVDEDRTPG